MQHSICKTKSTCPNCLWHVSGKHTKPFQNKKLSVGFARACNFVSGKFGWREFNVVVNGFKINAELRGNVFGDTQLRPIRMFSTKLFSSCLPLPMAIFGFSFLSFTDTGLV